MRSLPAGPRRAEAGQHVLVLRTGCGHKAVQRRDFGEAERIAGTRQHGEAQRRQVDALRAALADVDLRRHPLGRPHRRQQPFEPGGREAGDTHRAAPLARHADVQHDAKADAAAGAVGRTVVDQPMPGEQHGGAVGQVGAATAARQLAAHPERQARVEPVERLAAPGEREPAEVDAVGGAVGRGAEVERGVPRDARHVVARHLEQQRPQLVAIVADRGDERMHRVPGHRQRRRLRRRAGILRVHGRVVERPLVGDDLDIRFRHAHVLLQVEVSRRLDGGGRWARDRAGAARVRRRGTAALRRPRATGGCHGARRCGPRCRRRTAARRSSPVAHRPHESTRPRCCERRTCRGST